MNEIITDLLNYALDHKIGIVMTKELSSDSPSYVIPNLNTIFINSGYKDKQQIPFHIAHEIGHMMDSDFNKTNALYFTPTKAKFELSANKKAIDILLPFYLKDKNIEYINHIEFMKTFSIPYHLESLVINRIENYLQT